ncbi:succinylglutamate desuccinylase/aspartoacylase family protein [Mesorhizobium sp. M1348]|uniref:succinylglutamate desuccinylase/aspartoacylase domain-containing protein n=1 Tax=Mesorhizobium sp. M1348 TaxID=2957089 RepID=UPI00333BCE4A
MPIADTILDLHSFGPKWDGPPSVILHPIADANLMAKAVRVAEGFKLPVTLVWEHTETAGMFDTVAHNQGKVLVCSEFGGGTVGAHALAIYEAGVRNALIAFGLVDGNAEPPTFLNQKLSRTFETLISDELRSPTRGIFEPRCSIMEEVKKGDIIGVLRSKESLSEGTIEIYAPTSSGSCPRKWCSSAVAKAARERAVDGAVGSERLCGGHRRFPVGSGCDTNL